MRPSPEQGAGRPHGGRIDGGLREQATAEQYGDFLGVHLVVFGLTPLDRLPRPGVAQDQRQPFLRTQVGEPVPRNNTFDGDDHIVPLRCNGLEQGVGTGLHIAVQHHLAILTQDTNVHGAGMQGDAAVKWVLLGVEAPEGSSASYVLSLLPAYHGGMWRRGPQ